MTPRKGLLLIHLMVTVAIITILLSVFAALFQGVFSDIPRLLRLSQTNSVVGNVTRTMQQDIMRAESLPAAYAGRRSDPNHLWLQMPDQIIGYRWQDEQLSRCVYPPTAPKSCLRETVWSLRDARITWALRSQDNEPYAVEITKWVIRKLPGHKQQQRMKNSYITFINSNPGKRPGL